MQPSLPNFEDSVVEDLDPEPVSRRASSQMRELVLGLLLLAGVVAFASFQWWREEGLQREYRRARQATGERDWDQARALFERLGDYKDSASQVKEAARLAARRDDEYEHALRHMSEQEWPRALRAIREVTEIQPAYRDASDLEARLLDYVHADALDGAVVLRTRAHPAGLYHRTANAWHWLPGSDNRSALRGASSGGILLYDVPGDSGARSPAQAAASQPVENSAPDAQPGTPSLTGRHLTVATLPGEGLEEVAGTQLSLDPALYDHYYVGSQGVWAARDPGPEASPWSAPVPVAIPGPFFYQRYSNGVTSKVAFAGPRWAVVDVGGESDRLLLADWDPPVSPSRGAAPTVRLWIAEADGSNRRMVFTHHGEIINAQLGPDGRYVAATVSSTTGSPFPIRQILAVVLIGTGGEAPPYTALEMTKNIATMGYFDMPPRITFLSAGTHAGKLLLLEWGSNVARLSLIDPAQPDRESLDVVMGPRGTSGGWVVQDKEGSGLTIALWDSPNTQDSRTNCTFMAVRVVGTRPSISYLPCDDTGGSERLDPYWAPYIVGPVARGDRFVYSIETQVYISNRGGEQSFAVMSLPLSTLGEKGAGPTHVYGDSIASDAPFASSLAGRYLGPKLLAYVTGGELHARSYDGRGDVTLETGVTAIFDAGQQFAVDWLR